jgi:uncharacterized YigZ family protein
MNDDVFKTVEEEGTGRITEKKSKFISYALHVETEEEAKAVLDEYRKKYADARHVCWAYVLGWERTDFRFSDDGEPSGTAGRPILGQIHAAELTDVLVVVVRYFGGILLGTSGLIKAYKEAAAEAIANAKIVEKTVDDTLVIRFPYLLLNDVMRVLKQMEGVRWEQDFAEDCTMTVHVRKSQSDRLFGILSQIYGVEIAYL